MAVTDTLINTLFDRRYRIVRKLGAGGMANVYLAEDQELGRRVAIKILNDRHANDDQFVERFRREAKNAAGLSHPNIVSIYDRGEAEGTYYIAMEYLEGRSLKELIVARGPAPIALAIDYARQILGALRFAHRNGLVHRDIKPHNVLVDPEGRVKVTDFGIARAGASQMTEAGSIIGTAQYLSPEQARGAPVDQTSDLYSLGIVLYELLTGVVPFTGDTPVEIAMKHLSTIPDPPSTLRPEIPPDLDLVIMRALAKDPGERYQSAAEMDADLDRVDRGLAVSRETTDAATAIMARPTTVTAPTAATVVTPRQTTAYAPPYYEYEEAVDERRAVWPWLLALLLFVLAGLAGLYVYNQVQDELSESRPVAVPYLIDIREEQAEAQLLDKGLKPRVHREPNRDIEEGYVFRQDPEAGERVDRGSPVNLFVSTGPPKTKVPEVVGETSEDAAAALAEAGLKARVVRIFSGEEAGTVTAQNPPPGTLVEEGTRVRINVSKGKEPLQVPSVVGQPYETASSILQGAGFEVVRRFVDSTQPKGTVVSQSPVGNSLAPEGSTVTLAVSKGPTTSTVPEVTSQDEATARATLRRSGFQVQVVYEATQDPGLDGFVLRQSPAGGAQAPPGTTVTITVGRFEEPPPP